MFTSSNKILWCQKWTTIIFLFRYHFLWAVFIISVLLFMNNTVRNVDANVVPYFEDVESAGRRFSRICLMSSTRQPTAQHGHPVSLETALLHTRPRLLGNLNGSFSINFAISFCFIIFPTKFDSSKRFSLLLPSPILLYTPMLSFTSYTCLYTNSLRYKDTVFFSKNGYTSIWL